MSKKSLIFIDCEYCFTCAIYQGMVPNYKQMVDHFNLKYPDNEKYGYFLGAKKRKKNVADFLIKQGVEFVNIIDLKNVIKPQVIASQIALDVYKRFMDFSPDKVEFIFVSGNDYVIPVVDFLFEKGVESTVFYFPAIYSGSLFDRRCKMEKFSNSFLTFRSDNNSDEHP